MNQALSHFQKANPKEIIWIRLLIKLSIWLLLEIILTCLGLDDLADYGEYLSQGLLIQQTNPCRRANKLSILLHKDIDKSPPKSPFRLNLSSESNDFFCN